MKNKPSDFHPDLTEERILGVAQLIVKAYHDSLDYFVEEKGDNRWSHGCRRWVWVRKNIRDAIELGTHPYLGKVRDTGNSFIFKIGDVPFKHKRTDPDEPDDSIIHQAEDEIKQLSLAFAGLNDPCELSWRVLIEDTYEGEVLRVVFVGIDQHKQARCFWELPRDQIIPYISTTDMEERDEGVELNPAEVYLRPEPLETQDADKEDAYHEEEQKLKK